MTKLPLICFILTLGSCSAPDEVSLKLLNTTELREARAEDLSDSLYIISSYLIPEKEIVQDSITYVNAYLLGVGKKDTILVLDTKIKDSDFDLVNIQPWIEIDSAKSHKNCMVNATEDELKTIKKYKYKYCSLTLVIDD